MSSFQVDSKEVSEPVVSVGAKFSRSGVLRMLDTEEGFAEACAEKPGTAALVLLRSCGPEVLTSGVQRLKSVAHNLCKRLTYLFSVTRAEMPSVTVCRSWKSRSLEVPTTLQKTTKNGHKGYESIVLYDVSERTLKR